MKNVYLTGFMGAGKTSVGRLLAERLGLRYLDLDRRIEDDARLTVTEIFARFGEPHFRALETAALQRLATEQGLVVATGGGAVISAQNRRLMHGSGVIVNLTASVATVAERLDGDATRPLLQGDEQVAKITRLLAEREQFYAEADLRVATDGRSVTDLADEIGSWLSEGVRCGNDHCRT